MRAPSAILFAVIFVVAFLAALPLIAWRGFRRGFRHVKGGARGQRD